MAKWREVDIAMVGALAANFPQHDDAAWDAVRGCIVDIRDTLFALDSKIGVVEDNKDLSPEGVDRQRAALAAATLQELDAYKPLLTAKNAVTKSINKAETQRPSLPSAPTSVADVQLAAEIREHVARQEKPDSFVLVHAADERVVAAVLSAPAFLSGMKDEHLAILERAILNKLHPDRTEYRDTLQRALGVCEQAIKQAQRLIVDRAKMVRHPDGQWRFIRDPQPPLMQ